MKSIFLILFCIKFINAVNLPKVYVYDHPSLDWSYLLDCYEQQYDVSILSDERVEHAQNTGEIWMHKNALLYENRVYEIQEADFFYVPMYIALSSDMDIRSGSLMCNGVSHSERVETALNYLTKTPSYISKGGSDHILTCTWFWCGDAMGNHARIVFSRSFLGINEFNNKWAKWECLNKIITVPYTASSIITNSDGIQKIENKPFESRDIPFYFSGSSRGKLDRLNLLLVNDFVSGSQIRISDNWWKWAETAEEFADAITRSRYCFVPRGDTLSSRRLFDAIVGGCIPVLTERQIENDMVPYSDLLDYNSFSIIVHEYTFLNKKKLASLVMELNKIDEDKYNYFKKNLNEARSFLMYGTIDEKIVPNVKVFESFLGVIQNKVETDGTWFCNPTPFYEEHATRVSTEYFPPNGAFIEEWVSETEVLVNREHGLLMCSPPYTNSEFSNEYMSILEEKSEWEGTHKWDNDGVDFLKLGDYSFYDIFMGVDWIKSIFYRDPVVRVLDIFLSNFRISDSDFKPFVKDLYKNKKLEGDYKTISSHCGFRYSHYPVIIDTGADDDFTIRNFISSLPNPMNSIETVLSKVDQVKEKLLSCEYTKFYDKQTLNYIYELYEEDYKSFGIEKNWEEVLEKCTIA